MKIKVNLGLLGNLRKGKKIMKKLSREKKIRKKLKIRKFKEILKIKENLVLLGKLRKF